MLCRIYIFYLYIEQNLESKGEKEKEKEREKKEREWRKKEGRKRWVEIEEIGEIAGGKKEGRGENKTGETNRNSIVTKYCEWQK